MQLLARQVLAKQALARPEVCFSTTSFGLLFCNSVLKIFLTVVYICASLLHLTVESHALSKAEKKIIVLRAEKIQNMTILLIENSK